MDNVNSGGLAERELPTNLGEGAWLLEWYPVAHDPVSGKNEARDTTSKRDENIFFKVHYFVWKNGSVFIFSNPINRLVSLCFEGV